MSVERLTEKEREMVVRIAVKKGYAGQQGRGRDAACWLTPAGLAAYYELRPQAAGAD